MPIAKLLTSRTRESSLAVTTLHALITKDGSYGGAQCLTRTTGRMHCRIAWSQNIWGRNCLLLVSKGALNAYIYRINSRKPFLQWFQTSDIFDASSSKLIRGETWHHKIPKAFHRIICWALHSPKNIPRVHCNYSVVHAWSSQSRSEAYSPV